MSTEQEQRAEEIAQLVTELGCDPITAAFILAIEKGEIDGDVVELDEQGQED